MIVDIPNYNTTESCIELQESVIDKIISVKQLWDQYRPYTKSFVKHKWISRYINEKQKAAMEKHYEVLKAENTNYSSYKRSFNAICKFMGLPSDSIMLENVEFTKSKEDKDQDIIAVKYSKGRVKIKIPEGIRLIHVAVSKDGNVINALNPTFRSKVKGKYMYPNKRVFFTCIKAINPKKAGLEGAKTFKLTPSSKPQYAYIDPSCSDFRDNAVYIESDTPIPVSSL